MKQRICLLIVIGGTLLLSAVVQPGVAQNRGAFSFQLENDVFAGTDKYYTHGVKLTWISPDRMSHQSDPLSRRAISVSFGQNIYTPYDIEREDLIEDDRPYAGISYFTMALHRKRDKTMDTFELLLGIVGPTSLAAEVQRFVHSLYRGTRPQGWHHQLKDEIVFNFCFDKKWRIFRSGEEKKIGYDLIGHVGGSLGTLMTAAATGWQFRFGSNLPRDFGTFLLRPGGESGALFNEQANHRADATRSGIHGYIYVVGHAVYRNIFLDGNTFSDSHRVDKYPFVGDIVLGFVISQKRFKFSYAYVYRTKQFKTQARPHIFGAINISYVY
ncbi:MAG: lipid A deacylase LpxR family protein [Candidatus Aminicenantaceae bacterium]